MHFMKKSQKPAKLWLKASSNQKIFNANFEDEPENQQEVTNQLLWLCPEHLCTVLKRYQMKLSSTIAELYFH